MHFIDDQKMAVKTHRPHQTVFDAQHGQQGLVDRTHGNGGGQETLGACRRPEILLLAILRVIVPQEAFWIRQHGQSIGTHVAWNREQYGRGARCRLERGVNSAQHSDI